MQWFKAHADFVDHPKTLNLNSLLGDEHSLYYLVRLWAWTCKFAENGDLTKFSDDQIEQACGWRGEKSKLVSSFVQAGFIDKTEEKMRVHDWFKENTRHLKDKVRKRRVRSVRTLSATSPQVTEPMSALQDIQDIQDKRDITNLPEDGKPPLKWNPFSVLMSVFKETGTITTERNPRQIAILNARASALDEILFTRAVRAYTEDVWCQKAGLSVNGFLNSLDRLLNQVSLRVEKNSEKRPIRLLSGSDR